MISVDAAFSKQFSGVSFWETPDGSVQCNLRRRGQSSTFVVGIGATADDAWQAAWSNAGKEKTAPRRRNDEDLL